MRCSIHSTDADADADAGAGVCACCLRERLSALASSTAGESAVRPNSIRQKPDLSSAPQRFLCHRPARHSVSGTAPSVEDLTVSESGGGKLSIIPPILNDHNLKRSESDREVYKPSRSNFMLMALIRGRGRSNKKASRQVSSMQEDVNQGQTRKSQVPEVIARGLSPAPEKDNEYFSSDGEFAIGQRFPVRSLVPQKSTTPQHSKAQANQNPLSLSNLTLCLSPLVRPSPGNRRSFVTPELGIAGGEFRGTFNRRCERVSVPDATFARCPNRSRKLVDLGKAW